MRPNANLNEIRENAEEEGWDVASLENKASSLSDVDIAKALVVYRSTLVETHACPQGKARVDNVTPSWREEYEDNAPMWAWVRLLELEGLERGILPCRLLLKIEDKPTQVIQPKTRKRKRREPQPDLSNLTKRRIWRARRLGASWTRIEKLFGIQSDGTVARNACLSYDSMVKNGLGITRDECGEEERKEVAVLLASGENQIDAKLGLADGVAREIAQSLEDEVRGISKLDRWRIWSVVSRGTPLEDAGNAYGITPGAAVLALAAHEEALQAGEKITARDCGPREAERASILRDNGLEYRQIEETMGIGSGCGKTAHRLVKRYRNGPRLRAGGSNEES